MISDYYKTLTKRVVTQTADGGGSYSETLVDSDIQGFIAVMSAYEQMNNRQLGMNAVAKLFTDETLDVKNRIVDGTTVYEIIGTYDQFHKYYDLKKIT